MRPHRIGLAILLLVVVIGATPSVRAADEAPVATTPSVRVVRQNPMMAEIRAVLDGERATLARLNQRFRAAVDGTDAEAIQKEIAQVKLDSEMAVLRVQVKYARAGGREAVAAFLEGAIRAMQSPPVQLPAESRPVPVLTTTPAVTNTPR